ncbi:Acetyltransferase (isoleucine patch superfamily) [Formivibrio citricus]|uniref:Acetyltransferase (Isoleucine patch superfamily) n=1 Tax=Formivibrio citricus TaxID=83765 RepID=A0A1I4XWV9_9NEIS|nr:acyltransferase [Formivibrio citricus]SFN30294.1 Acetyltransferase (isoleucine patch superfamily) [Formivibrio citricus]
MSKRLYFIARMVGYLSLMAKKTYFNFFLRPGFKKLANDALILYPFRVDGAENIEIGSGSVMQRGGWLYCHGVDEIPARLKIGDGCVFGYDNHIASVRDVVIGNNVLTANNVYISDNLHGYEDIAQPIMCQPIRFKRPVNIGDGSWIGENACIIGARIGKNCVIGANSVVTIDVPDYSVAVGAPAIVIKQYDFETNRWQTVRRASTSLQVHG